MSENEKTSEGAAPVVVVPAVGSGHQPPRADCAYRADSADTKRSHAPLPPVFLQELKKVQAKSSSANEKLQTRYDECAAATMELKNLKEVSSDIGKLVSSEKKQSERVMESESLPQNVTKKMSAGVKKQKTEEITMSSLYSDIKPCVTPPYQPIPAPPETVAEDLALPVKPKEAKEEPKTTQDDDSITEDVAELRIPDAKTSDWSDEEEAGGLPRTASTASRVSRAVRRLFCCGYTYSAPSEDNSSHVHEVSNVHDYKYAL